MFTYYPRMNDIYTCMNLNHYSVWENLLNTTAIDETKIKEWLNNQTWTEQSTLQWQKLFNKATRMVVYGRSGHPQSQILSTFPVYEDLKSESCQKPNKEN